MAADLRQTTSNPDDDALMAAVARFKNNPYGWVLFAFPWKQAGTDLEHESGPDVWQERVLRSIAAALVRGDLETAIQVAVKSGHGIGKTALIAWIILWFISTRPNCQIVVTANTMTQLNTKTWREVAKWRKLCLCGHWFTYTATKLYVNGRDEIWYASAIAWSKERAEAFAGTHDKHVLLVFDEASKIPDIIWENGDGAMTTRGAMWIVFGNPTQNVGRFRECFGRFRHRWVTETVDSRTAKMANQAQIKAWVDDYGEDSDFVRVRVKGEFPRASTNQLIPSDIVEAAINRAPPPLEQLEIWPRILGVDVARFGNCQTVLCRRQGPVVSPLLKFRELDTQDVAGKITEIWAQFLPDACFIDGIGIGAGVVDRLVKLGYPVVDVNSGRRATDVNAYANKRAEMWVGIRDWLKGSVILPNDSELRDDLVGLEYGFDGQNRYQMEKKEDMMARGLASPDCADALALTFAEQVAQKERQEKMGKVARLIAGAASDPKPGTTWMSR